MRSIILALTLIIALPLSAEITPWTIDTDHSNLGFTTNHMMISEVEGNLDDFFAIVLFDENNITESSLHITARVASINTGNIRRDDHLRSKDFFGADTFPELQFRTKSISLISDNKYSLTGDLTIKGTTKEITVNLIYGGMVIDYWGNKRAAIKMTGDFNRFDFGLNWNELLETGGLIVGEKVNLHCNLEIFQQVDSRDLAG